VLRCEVNDFQHGGNEYSQGNNGCLQARYHSNAQVNSGAEEECVKIVVKSDVYLEGEASSPLYRRA